MSTILPVGLKVVQTISKASLDVTPEYGGGNRRLFSASPCTCDLQSRHPAKHMRRGDLWRSAVRMEQPPLNERSLAGRELSANAGGSASLDETFYQPDGTPGCGLR